MCVLLVSSAILTSATLWYRHPTPSQTYGRCRGSNAPIATFRSPFAASNGSFFDSNTNSSGSLRSTGGALGIWALFLPFLMQTFALVGFSIFILCVRPYDQAFAWKNKVTSSPRPRPNIFNWLHAPSYTMGISPHPMNLQIKVWSLLAAWLNTLLSFITVASETLYPSLTVAITPMTYIVYISAMSMFGSLFLGFFQHVKQKPETLRQEPKSWDLRDNVTVELANVSK